MKISEMQIQDTRIKYQLFREDFGEACTTSIEKAMRDYAKQRAADFLDWRQSVKRFPKDIIRKNPEITPAELYDEYLKTLK